MQGNGSAGTIANSRKLEGAISSFKIIYAEAEESENSQLIQAMIQFPMMA
jgi:hypothetical protein